MNDKEKQEKFLEIFELHRERFSRFARALTGNRDDALDLINDTILAVYQNFEKIKNWDAFGSYLHSISLRLYKRRNWRNRIFGAFNEDYAESIPIHETSSETLFDIELLYKALDKLPSKQKEAIILFEISGFSLEEIQKIQNGTVSGVKSRLKRGREKLAELLIDVEKLEKNEIILEKDSKKTNIYPLINDNYYNLRVENEYK